MRPIFTIHAGEFIVGEHLERKGLNVWVPTKDTGVDLLVTNSTNTTGVSFQVKFSRDYLTTHMDAELQDPMRAYGWFVLNVNKIEQSSAHFWVLVLIGSKTHKPDYVIIRPAELLKRLKRIHPKDYKIGKFHVYILITKEERCWEIRDLEKPKKLQIAKRTFADSKRDFSPYLNERGWQCALLPDFAGAKSGLR